MKVVFLGVGEAFDEQLPNTSLLLKTSFAGEPRSILLDCGFTVPQQFWRHAGSQEDLDAIWISHFHADHFFGVPALLVRFWEGRRTKPLTVLGQSGIEELIQKAMDLAYPNFLSKLTFPLEFAVVEPGKPAEAAGLKWSSALNGHGQRDLAVRIESGGRALFYSGDGLPTPETLEIARGCDLIVHEAFSLDRIFSGHGNIIECIDFARRARAGILALVHLQREERRARYGDILALVERAADLRVIVPEPGDELEL